MDKKKTKNPKLTYQELENYTKRLQADFENHKRRSQTEKTDFMSYANTDLILQILPVLDNFRLAIKHLPKELKDNPWVAGINHIETQLNQILQSEGLTEIKTIGETFDPHLHEALQEIESQKPPGEIIEEIQKGYRLKDKIIRHAKVIVAAEKKASKN